MPLFFRSKQSSKNLIILGAETGRIILSIVRVEENRSEKILYNAFYPFPSDDARESGDLARKMLLKIDEAFDDLVRKKASNFLHGADVLVLLGSPWHLSWSDEVSVQKDKAFKVTETLISDAVTDSFSKLHEGLVLIGKHVMGYRMNGYAMDNAVGKVTTMLQMKVYAESAPKVITDSIKQSISKHAPHATIKFTTSSFAAVQAVKDFSNSKNFLLIMPEYEVTDILLVRNGCIDTGASIPEGNATFARQLFLESSSGIEESFAKLKRLRDGTLAKEEFDRATKLLLESRNKFLTNFRSLLWKMNESLLLPADIFIVSSSVFAHFVKEWLEVEDYSKEAFTVDGFKIRLLQGKDMVEVLAIDPGESGKVRFETVSAGVVARDLETSAN